MRRQPEQRARLRLDLRVERAGRLSERVDAERIICTGGCHVLTTAAESD
jgi:hypothetical protein